MVGHLCVGGVRNTCIVQVGALVSLRAFASEEGDQSLGTNEARLGCHRTGLRSALLTEKHVLIDSRV